LKKLFYLALSLSLFVIINCKNGTKTSEGLTEESSDEAKFAVCIWDRAALKETPEEKGKWLESLSLGEKCEYLDDTKEDNSGSKPMKYYKVRLQGGKEGWVQATLISLDSKPAALSQNAELYSRADLLTKNNKIFNKMDIVAVKATQGDFIEITGKRKEGKWIESGWIKAANVTYSDVDIAVAKFGGKAMDIADTVKRRAAIKEIIDNGDFSNSQFINDLNVLIDTTSFENTVTEKIEPGEIESDEEDAGE